MCTFDVLLTTYHVSVMLSSDDCTYCILCRDLNKATPQQKALLLRVCEVLQANRLARLAVAEVCGTFGLKYACLLLTSLSNRCADSCGQLPFAITFIVAVNGVLIVSLSPLSALSPFPSLLSVSPFSLPPHSPPPPPLLLLPLHVFRMPMSQ